jgi:hypothetical protein
LEKFIRLGETCGSSIEKKYNETSLQKLEIIKENKTEIAGT